MKRQTKGKAKMATPDAPAPDKPKRGRPAGKLAKVGDGEYEHTAASSGGQGANAYRKKPGVPGGNVEVLKSVWHNVRGWSDYTSRISVQGAIDSVRNAQSLERIAETSDKRVEAEKRLRGKLDSGEGLVIGLRGNSKQLDYINRICGTNFTVESKLTKGCLFGLWPF